MKKGDEQEVNRKLTGSAKNSMEIHKSSVAQVYRESKNNYMEVNS